MNLEGKRVLVVGSGKSGVAAAELLRKKGITFVLFDGNKDLDVTALIEKNPVFAGAEILLGELAPEDMARIDLVVLSPGVPTDLPMVNELRNRQIPIWGEIELAYHFAKGRIIAITGTNGKTTTTSLVGEIMANYFDDVKVVGNIGIPYTSVAADTTEDTVTVAEISSFQLETTHEFAPEVTAILNITPDHLDRYNYEMQNYVDAKFRILQNQTKDDAFIFWNDDPIIAREIAKRHPEATLYPFAETHENGVKGYTENNQVVIETANGTFTMEQDLLALTGTHNLYNSLASGIASKIVDIHDEKIRASLSDFTGVEHRLEKVLRVRGVDYINDSKATNVNSCWYALQSMTTPVVLILGGTDKGNDYSEIEELVNKKVHSLIFMGVDNTKLHAFFDGKVANIEDARSMEEAVAKAYKMAHKGDTVLLSPCCASFDLFKSYEDRGDQFKACVRNL